MSLSDENKQKRNKPCESCRTHRRKCNVTEGNQCDRCLKMNLVCVFKFTAKPTVLKKAVPFSKKNRMLEQVRIMKQEMVAMETQLRAMNLKVCLQSPNDTIYASDSSNSSNSSISSSWSDCHDYDSTSSQCSCSELSHCHNKRIKYDTNPSKKTNDWQLTVRQGSKGISFQTSIKSMADVVTFLTESLHYFNTTGTLPRTPNYHADRSHQTLIVTNKMLQAEYIIHSFFKNKKEKQRKLLTAEEKPPIQFDAFSRTQLKRQLINAYFDCPGLISPIFPKPYFSPLFASQPDGMLVTSIAAYITYSHCRHISQIPLSSSRETVAESLRREAKAQLQDILFDEEPSIFTACSLCFLSQCAMITLENVEARLYMNLAWRMVLQLKDRYADILSHITPDTPVTPEIATAESWRRLFYFVRYLEVTLYLIYDGLADFSSIVFDMGIGFPTVLASERLDKEINDAVLAFHHTVRLQSCQTSVRANELKYQLFAGKLDSVPVADIALLESQLLQFWSSLPVQFQLSDSPLEYLRTDRIQQCQNPFAIYLNQLYYTYWMALETRLMQSPAATDLRGASMERFDGDRALLIVSLCCDAISKIFHVLFCRLPCSVDLHWLLIACDATAILRKAANPHIKQRAHQNLKVTSKVLKQRMVNLHQQEDEYTMFKSMLPLAETTMSTSTSSTSLASSDDSLTEEPVTLDSMRNNHRPPAAYFGEMKKTLNAYFSEDF